MKTVTSSVAVTVTVSRPFGMRGARVMIGVMELAMVECLDIIGLGFSRLPVPEDDRCWRFQMAVSEVMMNLTDLSSEENIMRITLMNLCRLMLVTKGRRVGAYSL